MTVLTYPLCTSSLLRSLALRPSLTPSSHCLSLNNSPPTLPPTQTTTFTTSNSFSGEILPSLQILIPLPKATSQHRLSLSLLPLPWPLSLLPPLPSLQTQATLGFSSVYPTSQPSSLSSLPSPYPSSLSLFLTALSCKWAVPHTWPVSSPSRTKLLPSPVIFCLTSLSLIILLVCLLPFALTAWPSSRQPPSPSSTLPLRLYPSSPAPSLQPQTCGFSLSLRSPNPHSLPATLSALSLTLDLSPTCIAASAPPPSPLFCVASTGSPY
jgi:hypothetical protein